MIPRIGSKLIARGPPLVEILNMEIIRRRFKIFLVVHTHKRKRCVFAHAH